MMTIVENCKMAEVDAFRYLRDVFSNVGVITNQNIEVDPGGLGQVERLVPPRPGLGVMAPVESSSGQRGRADSADHKRRR